MISYYGDFAEDDTVLIPFNTFSSDDPSASVTITNLADADIMVHKDGGTTQIATDGATVAIDFDSITGNHLVTIDTSVHADYSTGSEYAVRIEGTTVDGATVNAWIGAFSIERAGGALALIKAGNLSANVAQWNGTNVASPDTAGYPVVTVKDGTGTGEIALTSGAIDNVTLVATTTTNTDMRGTDSAALASTLASKVPQNLNLTASGNIGIDWANVENPTTALDLSGTDIQLVDTTTTNTDMRGTDSAATAANLATAQADLDIITGADGVVLLSGTQASIDAIEIDTGTTLDNHLTDIKGTGFVKDTHSLIDIETYVDLIDDGTSGLAKIATDVAAVLVDTADIQPKIGTPAADISADIAAVKVDTAATLVDTADMQPKLGTPAGADMSADIAAVKVDTAATLVDTAEIGTAGAGLTDLGGMSTGMKAEVNTEAADVLFTDTDAEPAQGTPGATISIADKIGYLYKAWRNRSTTTATQYNVYNDDATTIDHKSTLSDDGTTADKTEVTSGP